MLQLLSETKDRDIIKIVFAIMKIDHSIQYQEMQRPTVTLIFEDLVNLRYISCVTSGVAIAPIYRL